MFQDVPRQPGSCRLLRLYCGGCATFSSLHIVPAELSEGCGSRVADGWALPSAAARAMRRHSNFGGHPVSWQNWEKPGILRWISFVSSGRKEVNCVDPCRVYCTRTGLAMHRCGSAYRINTSSWGCIAFLHHVRYPSIARREGAALLLQPSPVALAMFESLGRCVAVEDEEKFRYLACAARTCRVKWIHRNQ